MVSTHCLKIKLEVLLKKSFNCATRAAMTSIQQLRGDLISSGDHPSTNLATYFKVSFEFLVTKNVGLAIIVLHPYCPVNRIVLWTQLRM